MHRRDHEHPRHHHRFGQDTRAAEGRTRLVVAITAAMMLVEIVAGWLSNSMSLLADGWHMGTHVAAFAITLYAYAYGRRHADDPRYSFGTGKVGVLGGFGSAVLLMVVAALMAIESLQRLLQPGAIHFDEALLVAVIGLIVNLVCALLFRDVGHGHAHEHGGHEDGHQQRHGHGEHEHRPHDGHGCDHHSHHGHEHHDHDSRPAQGMDLNLRSAYLHVLADALTSVAAILALLGGKFLGWAWLDPTMGLAGSTVIALWAHGLLRETGGILLDRTPGDSDLSGEIRKSIENDGDSLVTDLHVWQVGAGQFAAIVVVAAHQPRSADDYRARLSVHRELVHVNIEFGLCPLPVDGAAEPCERSSA